MKIFETIPEKLDLNNPKFEDATRVHDWRNHVLYQFTEDWENLTDREKKIIYIIAEDSANDEVWD